MLFLVITLIFSHDTLFYFNFLQFFLLNLQAKPVEIVMWHSLAGQLGEKIGYLVKGFNQSQNAYAIKLIYKGNIPKPSRVSQPLSVQNSHPLLCKFLKLALQQCCILKGLLNQLMS